MTNLLNYHIVHNLAITTLVAARTLQLSLLSGILTTGYLTFADKIMIRVYSSFLYKLASSVFIMRLVDSKKPEDTLKIKSRAISFYHP